MAKRKTVKKNKQIGLLAILGGLIGLMAIIFVVKGLFLKPAEEPAIFELSPNEISSSIYKVFSDDFNVLDTKKWWIYKTADATVSVKDGKLRLTVPRVGQNRWAQIKTANNFGGLIQGQKDITVFVKLSKPQINAQGGTGASTIIIQESGPNFDPIAIIDWVQNFGEDSSTLSFGSYVDKIEKFSQKKQIQADELGLQLTRTNNVYSAKYTAYKSGKPVAQDSFNSFTLKYPDPVSIVLAARNDYPKPGAVTSLFDSISIGVEKE